MNGSSVKTDQMLGGIRDSARFIAEQSRHVHIPPAGIQKASEFLADHFNSVDGERYSADRISEAWHRHRLHPSSQDPVECANHLLLMDLLNFSFFSDNDGDDTSAAAAVEYSVTFGGERYTGYWTLCACLMRAKDEGVPITDANYWAQISQADGERIFRSDTPTQMPLLSTRLELIRQTGGTLINEFNGQFAECVRRCGKNAGKLVELLAMHFPSFRDEATFHNRPVQFYKRAQILVADCWACYGGSGLGEFHDINEITMFADYRVPQILVGLGALEYSAELTEFLRSQHTMQSGDERECEIRGNSIHAVELIVEELRKQLTGKCGVNAITVDFFLWDYAKQHRDELADIPIHRVRSFYY